jgi:hypothetical protein
MAKRAGITAAYARAILEYDPQTGFIKWKPRPVERFATEGACKTWNTRFAGKAAGALLKTGFKSIAVDEIKYMAHRLAWLVHYGEWAAQDIDHVNGCPSDNRVENLRLASVSQNQANSRRPCHNTSGYKGVSWHRQSRRWRAAIVVSKRQISLGLFTTAEAAHAAYAAAAAEHFGEFARLK